jgi:hypothetical protein
MSCEKRIVNPKSGARLVHDGETFDQIHRARQNRVAQHRFLRFRSPRRRGIFIAGIVTAWPAD